MKKNLLLSMLCLFSISIASFGQITTGTPTAKQIRVGNRASAGDFGIYLGGTSEMFKGLFDGNIKMKAMPLINLKYMASDELEFRVGLEFWKKSQTDKGEIEYEEYDKKSEESITKSYDTKERKIESRNYIYPGIAYHFSKHNLLDVYAGAELPLGWERYKVVEENGKHGEFENSERSTSRGTFNIGLGAFIGLQAYVANLPIAIGVEYGISSMFHGGLKYKHTSKYGDEKEQTYYTKTLLDGENSNQKSFSDLKAKQGEIGSQFRFTLTYYFK